MDVRGIKGALFGMAAAAATVLFVSSPMSPAYAGGVSEARSGKVSIAATGDANDMGSTEDLKEFTINAVKGASIHRFRFVTVAPAGGELIPARAAAGGAITSEVIVQDGSGTTLGAYDAPWALDSDGNLVSTSFRIDGTTLVQDINLPADTKFPVTFNSPLFSTFGTERPSFSAQAAAGKVTIPSDYVYDPSLGSLHDYCTSSPDSYLWADFRGPCAIHDMCYEKSGKNKSKCDSVFFEDLLTNCRFAYGALNPLRQSCFRVATVYYGTVIVAGDDPA